MADAITFVYISILFVSCINAYDNADEIYGGHTRDFRAIDSDESWDNIFQDWHTYTKKGRVRRDAKDIPSIEEIQKYVNTFKADAKLADAKIKEIVKTSAYYSARLKDAKSIQGKIEKNRKLGYKNYGLQNLTDIIGMRLTCQTVLGALAIRAKIKSSTNTFKIVEEKCYGMCPGKEKYRPDGYRRIHFILSIVTDNKKAELQIGTKYTDVWADWSHDLIYKGPVNISSRPDVKAYALLMADYLWTLDNERNKLPICPDVLKQSDALDILKKSFDDDEAEKIFKKLGKPPNACFWWNDMGTNEESSSSSSSVVVRLNYQILALLGILFYVFC